MVGSEGVEPLAEAPDLQSFAVYLTVTLPIKWLVRGTRLYPQLPSKYLCIIWKNLAQAS